MTVSLLGPAEIRALAERLGARPTKSLGQNFVIDPNTVRRIARLAQVGPGDLVAEIGPGLGSLTLALLETGAGVVAVEIDPVLAGALPGTIAERAPDAAARFRVIVADALAVDAADLVVPADPMVPADLVVPADPMEPGDLVEPGDLRPADLVMPAGGVGTGEPAGPSALVANLPYNVAVPVLLTLLERVPSLRTGLVMVQAEVAERLAARPGEPAYGVPSVKAAWYADVRRAGAVPRQVFWPVPKVESGLVAFTRRDPPPTPASRVEVFACVDAAFAQRRKTLRAALAGWAGSAAAAEAVLRAAGVDPSARGERLSVHEFAAVAAARPQQS